MRIEETILISDDGDLCFNCGIAPQQEEFLCKDCIKTGYGAVIKGKYRYVLRRVWNTSPQKTVFMMLNPSTADHLTDDPTIKKCVHFAKKIDCGSLEVVNLFAYRETDPENLKNSILSKQQLIGPENWFHVKKSLDTASTIILAWGNNAKIHRRFLDQDIINIINKYDCYCLGLTKEGHPRHPLYVPNNKELEVFPGY